MIQDQFHPLDEIGAWGCTAHGLVRFDLTAGQRLFIDDVPWPLPGLISASPRVLQVVRQPGIAPVPLSAEVLAAEREKGRVWQNYALLLSDFFMFGHPLGGWIYFASDGKRWLIRPGSLPNARAGQPYSLTLQCRPFGYLDEASTEPPVSLPISLADIGQEGTGSRFVSFETISSDGGRAILRLFPVGGGLPTGFLEVRVSDVGGVPVASLLLLKSQAAVRGQWATSHPGISTPVSLLEYRAMYPRSVLVGAVYPLGPALPMFPIGGGNVTLAVTDVVDVDSSLTAGFNAGGTYARANLDITSGRAGRLLALQFDDEDQLCEFTYDTQYEYTLRLPAWSTTHAGQLTTSGASSESQWVGVNQHPWAEAVPVQATAQRSVSERIASTLIIRRNGDQLMSLQNEKSYSAQHTATLPPPGGTSWCWSRVEVGTGGNITGVGRRGADGGITLPFLIQIGGADTPVNATAVKGGPWPVTTSTGPAVSVNGGSPAYASEMPVGSTQRDADRIDMALGSIGYLTAQGPGFGVQFFETEPAGTGLIRRELALLFPHAAVLARGELPAVTGAAYHPVTHELVTDGIGGIPETFI